MMEDADLESLVEEVLTKSGLDLLEFHQSRHRGGVTIKAVIKGRQGTGTEECAKASRLILAQAQAKAGVQNPSIEVSSPGIDRIFKSERDWKAFRGEMIRWLPRDASEWQRGTLIGYDSGIAKLETATGSLELEVSSVAKARLDSMNKGE
ncbi:MAG TPA: hypothetical protein VIO60_00870 [Rectinemataceae bacterium]